MTTILNSGIISVAGINTWNAALIHLAQQKYAKLRPWVMEKYKGTTHDYFTRIAKRSSVAEKTDLRTTTPDNGSTYTNRVAVPKSYHDAFMLDKEELARVLIDPKAGQLHAMAMNFARYTDSLVIAAATAAALTDDGSTTDAFDADQAVGDATTEFDFDLVNSVLEKFQANDIDDGIEKCFVISPNCARKMRTWDEATSGDYTNVKALVAGKTVENWMGFTWVVSNLLTDPAPTSSQRYALAFTRQAIGMLVEQDVQTKVAERADKCHAWQAYSDMILGCVRVEDEHLVKVHILES